MEPKDDRITVEALKFYVPLFHKGDRALEALASGSVSDPHERSRLEILARLRELSVKKIASLSGPLITRELNKILSGSHLRGKEGIYDLIYCAAIDGLEKGMRHFDVEKINKSSTNYLFQWLTTYAKKELVNQEAPFGIPPTRFVKYKKISAVRKRLSDELGRYATNEEVYDFFQSGKADRKNMNGRVKKRPGPYASNQKISLEIIMEQEEFEKNLNVVAELDNEWVSSSYTSVRNEKIFDETFIGCFITSYNFTDTAKSVIMSELGFDMTDSMEKIARSVDKKTYRKMMKMFASLMSDPQGVFYEFAKDNKDVFDDIDVTDIIESIRSKSDTYNGTDYRSLFEDRKPLSTAVSASMQEDTHGSRF